MEVKQVYSDFYPALQAGDKIKCYKLVQAALTEGLLIQDLYQAVLEKSLYTIASQSNKQSLPVWQEHLQTNIVLTLIETAFPYVMAQKQASIHKRVLVCCPMEEYHFLGARMTYDFFTLLGFEAYYLGANTPDQEILCAVKDLSPDLVSISVTNYYHLSRVKHLVKTLKQLDVKVSLGGYAIQFTQGAHASLGADFYPYTYEDLEEIKEVLYETGL